MRGRVFLREGCTHRLNPGCESASLAVPQSEVCSCMRALSCYVLAAAIGGVIVTRQMKSSNAICTLGWIGSLRQNGQAHCKPRNYVVEWGFLGVSWGMKRHPLMAHQCNAQVEQKLKQFWELQVVFDLVREGCENRRIELETPTSMIAYQVV